MSDDRDTNVERFRRLEQLFHAAQELPEAQQSAYLDQACADDQTLRLEVATLLAVQPQARDFLAESPYESEAHPRGAASRVGHAIQQYLILAPLGKGGMGEVWLAEDTHLKRRVALKLLPEEFSRDADRVRRFELEAHAILALNHPNIITLFDFGHTAEGYFITTELVEGVTLRARLRTAHCLPAGVAIEIALQICAALSATHEAGLIHRDLKPENVMLRRDGYLKVLDFGLAKISTAQPLTSQTAASSLTQPGTVMGTVSYMSPEQARGQKVDARTDIFSLGIVLYEMLAGRLPFAGETINDILAAILKSEPLPWPEDLPEAVPVKLQHIIAKALAKDRAARYQTVQALSDDLRHCAETLHFQARHASQEKTLPYTEVLNAPPKPVMRRKWPLYGGVLLIALLVGLWLTRQAGWWTPVPEPATPVPLASIKTLAVLPFRFLGSERAEEYLSLGLTESLITKLSGTRQLIVRPISVVLKYQHTTVEPTRAARELKTDAVLDGSVQKSGDKLRVSVQLIRAGDVQPLWAGEFDEAISDLFLLQDKLAIQMTRALSLRLTAAEERQLAKHPTDNTEAYKLYLKGRLASNQTTTEGLKQGIEYMKQAVAADPTYARAYAGLAASYFDASNIIFSPDEALPKVKAAALRALTLDETLAEAYTSLAVVKERYELNWAEARQAHERALALDPNDARAYLWYGSFLIIQGQLEEAIAALTRARELDPLAPYISANIAWVHYLAHRPDEAIEQLKKMISLEPGYFVAHYTLGLAYEQKGMHEEARAEFKEAQRLDPESFSPAACMAYSQARWGSQPEARRHLEELIRSAARRHVDPYTIAVIQAALGEQEQASLWIEKAFQIRSEELLFIKVDPRADRLRTAPRFPAWLQRLHLTP
ncbi:MAG TPA: protein kinase [Blastocatellia bacterium]|nr:protein kinase [Blastocatellia bacterium]